MLLSIALFAGCPPVDGPLAAGTWGGEHYDLEVASDATGTLEGDCAHGAIDTPMVLSGGAFSVDFTWVAESPVQHADSADTGEAGSPVTLDATVSGRTLTGTLSGDGWTEAISLELGATPQLYKCM